MLKPVLWAMAITNHTTNMAITRAMASTENTVNILLLMDTAMVMVSIWMTKMKIRQIEGRNFLNLTNFLPQGKQILQNSL